MPNEIKELITEASKPLGADQEERPVDLASEEELNKLTEIVLARIRSESILGATERRELLEELKREVKQMLEDQWRK